MENLKIIKTKNSVETVKDFQKNLEESGEVKDFPLQYPTLYIGHAKDKNGIHKAYVGETDNIIQRTKEHLMTKNEDSLKKLNGLNAEGKADLYIVKHRKFNKSATLLLEQKFMDYLLGDPKYEDINSDDGDGESVLNRRNNAQSDFYQKDLYEKNIFPTIWNELFENGVVSDMAEVENSALFANSPFKDLSDEQFQAKLEIEDLIQEYLKEDSEETKVIKISGLAGTGKTVLMSALFKDLYDMGQTSESNKTVQLLVRQPQQLKIYEEMANKLNMKDGVSSVSSFVSNKFIRDIVLVDEAHALWSGNHGRVNSEEWDPDLISITEQAKIVVLIYDSNQVTTGKSYLSQNQQEIIDNAKEIKLTNQWRMEASEEMRNFIQGLGNLEVGILNKSVPRDDKFGYELHFFDSVEDMYQKIVEKDKENGLSRMLATVDWHFSQTGNIDDCMVEVGDFRLPWNLKTDEVIKGQKQGIPWQEIPESINEVGSQHTVQGSDLNYVGLILGPSIQYDEENESIKIDPTKSQSYDALKNYSIYEDPSGEELREHQISNLKHTLNILLTRGVHGLYIYAVDSKLREKLLQLNQN
ncbi:DUF2075 family protein [Weissella uvarum]|uniref:DNA/RNA helicase domain-containing protein n=1 Tax=Weissella uvarum TaxID=1479233 RepID=UPI00196182EE|nr:DNA/RNA helicase domain-containing protein [Weissella uvarum]MBM7616588.1 DUF2075 family protein [Weissella uvarum]MCM0594953.1 DUF2075 domain-containing protein [Weissella uvarum]